MARVVKFTASDGADLYICPDLIFSVRPDSDPKLVYIVSDSGFGYQVKDPIDQVLGAWRD